MKQDTEFYSNPTDDICTCTEPEESEPMVNLFGQPICTLCGKQKDVRPADKPMEAN